MHTEREQGKNGGKGTGLFLKLRFHSLFFPSLPFPVLTYNFYKKKKKKKKINFKSFLNYFTFYITSTIFYYFLNKKTHYNTNFFLLFISIILTLYHINLFFDH
jgi:predicted neutral ceramidase superfamily lipid hydrolase